MIPNENGSRLEQICAWVPCVVYLRERERERKKGYVCMKHCENENGMQCMII